ncbi:uncharacterized protein [Antedon mediterranea]|uniref:uncharacterized protein n=1 Tax=Antedon mediterranea TaxID=105859 RepID=UPI003AF7C12A
MDSGVNAVSVDQWELCKENVQPLKKGRNFTSLTSALHVDHDEHQRSLLAQRQQFEEELRSYKGDDALSVWTRYINWTEQSYPTGGKESNLEQILHTCVSLFKDDKKYHNDPRYVHAWIKMANNYLDEPSTAFQFMHDKGIGTNLTIFYEAWSWNLEQAGNTKKADAVLSRGLECFAAPIEQLVKYHKDFQTRIIRGTMEGAIESMETNDSAATDERTVLGGLRGRGKHHKVGTQRIGHVKKDPKGLTGLRSREPLAGNQRIAVFYDENAAAPVVPDPTGQWASVPSRAVDSKENVQKPSQWTSHKVPPHGLAMPPPVSRPSVVVHVDDDTDQITAARMPPTMNHPVLSARKPEKKRTTVQYLNAFPTTDDKTKVMYPKHLIYGGVSEMSLEELRAIRYKEKKREQLLIEEQERIQREKDELIKTKEALRLQQEELEKERLMFQHKMQQERLLYEEKLQEQQRKQEELRQQELLQHQSFQEQEQQLQEAQAQQLLQQQLQQKQELLKQQQQEQQRQKLLEQQQQQDRVLEQQRLLEQQQQQDRVLEQQRQQKLCEQQHKIETRQSNSKPNSTNSSLRRDSDSTREFTITKQLIFEDTTNLQAEFKNISVNHASFTTTPSTNCSGMFSTIPQPTHKTPSLTPRSFCTKNTPQSTGITNKTPGSESSMKRSFIQPTPKSQSRSYHDLQHVTPGNARGGIAAPSPTVNTKEALGCVMAMLSKPLDEELFGCVGQNKTFEKEEEMFEVEFANTDGGFSMMETKQDVCSQESLGCRKPFTIYDETTVEDDKENELKTNKQFTVFTDSENKAPICVYEDQDEDLFNKKQLQPHSPEEVKMVEGMEAMTLHLQNRSTSQDCTFAPHGNTNPDFSAMSRMVSTPFNRSEMPLFPVSHIKPSLVNTVNEIPQQDNDVEMEAVVVDKIVEPAACVMSVGGESFDTTEATVNNNSARHLSPIIEENSSDCSNSSQNKTRGSSTAHTSHHQQAISKTETSTIDMNVTRRRGSKSSSSSSTSSVHPDISHQIEEDVNISCKIQETSDTSHFVERAQEVKPDTSVFDASAMDDDYCEEDELDPFSNDVIDALIANLDEPLTSYSGYSHCEDSMPDVRAGITLYLGKYLYSVESKIGEGAFAKVYRAAMLDADDDTDLDGEGSKVILKVQKPACPWEFYICRQIAERIQGLDVKVDVRPSIMNIDSAFVYNNGSILLNEAYYNGTLLNLVNMRNKNIIEVNERLVLYITIEILHIIDQLHRCGIIHGDIKPDNFLIRNSSPTTLQTNSETPSILGERTSGIKLIDMGCSIDMKLFPPGTVFRSRNGTSCFECTEMTTGRPWTYQTDLYGIAGTVHALIFGNYMKVFEESGEWKITGKVKRRYRADWKKFFKTLLNVPNCNEIPSLSELCLELEDVFRENYRNVYSS